MVSRTLRRPNISSSAGACGTSGGSNSESPPDEAAGDAVRADFFCCSARFRAICSFRDSFGLLGPGPGSGSGVGALRRVAEDFFAKEGLLAGVKLVREGRAGEGAPRGGRFGIPRRGVDMQLHVGGRKQRKVEAVELCCFDATCFLDLESPHHISVSPLGSPTRYLPGRPCRYGKLDGGHTQPVGQNHKQSTSEHVFYSVQSTAMQSSGYLILPSSFQFDRFARY